MFRLIVRFHQHSLGRDNVAESLHWRNGILLQDRYGARALVVLDRDRLRITVRSVYPQAFLYPLMQGVRDCVENFWKGLTTQVLVPCQSSCGRRTPGVGLFDLDKLYSRMYRGNKTILALPLTVNTTPTLASYYTESSSEPSVDPPIQPTRHPPPSTPSSNSTPRGYSMR